MLTVNIKFNYRKIRQTLILYIMFITTLQTFMFSIAFCVHQAYDPHFDSATVGTYILLFWSVNMLSMSLSQTILLIVAIKNRFGALNFFLVSRSYMKIHQLKIVSKIHLKLTEIIEMMNRTYCMMAMFFLAGAFCLFNLFLFSLKSVIVMFNFESFYTFMSRVLVNTYSFTLTMMVIVMASQATSEAKRTIRIIFEMLHQIDHDAEWIAVSQNFVQQISFSQTKFTCGLFTYDWYLFFKVSL